MSQLIALVATAVLINGKRTVIQPGEPLPELSNHDARELVQSGAAELPAQTAYDQRNAADDAARAQAEVDASRRLVEEENAAREQAAAEAAEATRVQAEQEQAKADAAAAAASAAKAKAAKK